MTGLVDVGYMPEVFNFKKTVSWCAHRFDSKSRMIWVATEGKNLVLLNPKVLKRMLQLPTLTRVSSFPKSMPLWIPKVVV
jgi:hypothetical protein